MKQVFFALIFLISLLVARPVMAQENTTTSSAVLAPIKSDYVLPYPGILPDNPLYSIKMIRDRIILFLINDSVKKAEFTLLQADKRLQAGVTLYREDPQEIELALETIAKGENYFFQSIQHAKKVRSEGRTNFNSLVTDLRSASLKHEEVLRDVEKGFPKEYRGELSNLIKRVEAYQKQVDSIMPIK